jgi:anti-sigma-K factor RskA
MRIVRDLGKAMNISNNPALLEQLAASYALGTLRGGARRRFETLARQDVNIRAVTLVWQSRMGSIAELQPAAAPSPAVWKRIDNLVRADREARAIANRREAAKLSDSASDSAAGRGWWSSPGLWRGVAVTGAVVAAVALVAGSNLNDLNGQLQGQVAQLRGQNQQLSATLAATPDIQYVSVLADEKQDNSILVTFDPKNNRLTLKRTGNFDVPADQSLQLWALPNAGGPQSLGVLGREPVIRLASTGNAVREAPTLAISLEPIGGAPAGSGPTGPVLFKGTVIETPR